MALTLPSQRWYCLLRLGTTLFRSMATSRTDSSVTETDPSETDPALSETELPKTDIDPRYRPGEGGGLVSRAEVERFITDCFVKVGCGKDSAKQQAQLLVAADYRGHFSHGLNRLEIYLNDIRKKLCDPNGEPRIMKQTSATALVNGMNSLGAVVGNFCMRLAITKAADTGVGLVVANNSNHFGMAGYYSEQAVKVGMVGLSFTNTSPLMCPTGAKQAALGTNPLSIAAPIGVGLGAEAFVLDMATTSVALGKIEIQIRKEQPIPLGWALDEEGNPTTDPQVAYNARRMMPLGGLEETSGYKGYGLAMLVEILCGILGGSNFGPFIRDWESDNEQANLGQCFIAIDPKCFGDGFRERMEHLVKYLRDMPPVEKGKPVLVPGDPEKANMEKVDRQGGIIYLPNQINSSYELAVSLGVKPMLIIEQK
ncbi:uncharacterized oxidoreductase YjmC [Anabrus simplex]|uniref:uncharacterized oxidoreductase YjmC n=1 Tax=Anabrus simplex TaxID=316456 RepID=UPI0035A39AA7